MAFVYQAEGRKIYSIEFRDQHGRRRKISARTTDKRVAQSKANKIEEDADRIRAGMPPIYGLLSEIPLGLVTGPMGLKSWKEFRQRYERECLGGKRAKTVEKGIVVLNVFEQTCHPKTVQGIDEQMVSEFAARLRERPIVKNGTTTAKIGLAPWTVKNYLGALHAALRWAAAVKLIRTVPAFPTIKPPKLRPQPIAEADWLKLLAQAPNALWGAYLMCGWYGGLRLAEAYRLRRLRTEEWPWLDLEADRIVLPARFVKAGEDQWIPLHPVLRSALAALPDTGDEIFPFRSRQGGGPLSQAGLSQNIIHLAHKAGVRLSMHRLRKGFGCRVAAQLGKGNAPVLHRLMRHSSMQITMDFYASVDDVLHDAIHQLDQAPPVHTPAHTPTAPESPKGLTA